MEVLVAPDKFRGTLTAAEAAGAIGRGWRRSRPDDVVVEVPMADGGEGTLEALVASLDGAFRDVRVDGPLGDPVTAQYGLVPGADGITAVVEMARASGLALVPPARHDAVRASTRGTGQLIRTAIERHAPATVLVCIGGSATTDGGAGMAQALGARLLDAEGEDISPGGMGLLELSRIDLSGLSRLVGDTTFIVACDVDNPLTGPRGAAAVYGPQKGAGPEQVLLLDRALGHYAAIVHRDLGIDLGEMAGAGAAGGLGGGLVAFLGARLRAGVEVVMEAVRLRERMGLADFVITGEGKLDEQSFNGKTVAGVVRAAEERGLPVAVVCGRATVDHGSIETRSLVGRFGVPAAMEDTRRSLETLVRELADDVGDGLVGGDRRDPDTRKG